MPIDKEFLPSRIEERRARAWVDRGLFRARPDSESQPFCMVIPPPNVTGNLHIGHVLVYTLHDIVARWRRMQGRDVLWLPGTDHAGIATQAVVERKLAKEGTSRTELGRGAFERRVWEWKETYGGRITDALRRLGSSCDWSRERFTLDDGLSRAVREVFVRLYDEGSVYRDRYIVNWCPGCRTAISDLETVHEEVRGKLWTVRYPSAGGRGKGVQVATTRPETMLGDTAVAVHPDDERYRELVGRHVRLPLADREIPVVTDPFVDPSFGTGAVKITPAHDPNDFDAAKRLGLEEIVVIDTTGKMTEAAGAFSGLDRFQARKKVLQSLEKQGLLVETRDHRHAVGHCQRCGTMIEPLLSTQWFVRVESLAAAALQAVEVGRTEFVPPSWAKTYFEWMRNIHDWCISRQLWWGHRIPAWYCDSCNAMFVRVDPPGACESCSGPLRQDEDVLDTWFSSALWPFSTLGWPEKTQDLARYYPTSLLITGFDIIFFWVARMMMMGLKFMGEVPFAQVYIHGLVRDARGQKMSKSKGNTIEPSELQERYGTDAVRFTMAILAAPGNDIPLAPERMEGYRAFINKLWNACRFVLMKVGDVGTHSGYREKDLALIDRWILSRTNQVVADVDRSLTQYRFDRAAETLYHFVWHEFCDWYIEMVKPDLGGSENEGGGKRAETARAVLLEVLDVLLRLLHPFAPFVTEELWERFPAFASAPPAHPAPDGQPSLALARWPESVEKRIDVKSERDVDLLRELAVKVRNLRAESNIDPSRRIEVLVHATSKRNARLVAEQARLVGSLVRASEVRIVPSFPDGLVAARGVVRGLEIAIPLEGLLDIESERARILREIEKVDRELVARNRKLQNESFLERAPAPVVEKEKRLQKELLDRKKRLDGTLTNLSPDGAS